MEVSKQRKSIVPTKQNGDSRDYVRTDHANNQAIAIALLLSQEAETEIAGNGKAYIQVSAFRLFVFYDRYFPPPMPALIAAGYMMDDVCCDSWWKSFSILLEKLCNADKRIEL